MQYKVITPIRVCATDVYDPAAILAALLRAGLVKPMPAPAVSDDAGSPMWHGKYLVHIEGRDELRRCLKELGVPINGNPSAKTLIAKRDEYLEQIRKNRRSDA